MLHSIIEKFQYGRHFVTLETGIMARQSTASVMVNMDDTSVFVTVVCEKTAKPDQNFFPLTVNYQERTYSVGRFPGGFFRRETRSSENEILISRLIDRPIRPLFPEDFLNEVQIVATVVSMNPQVSPDIVAIIGASAALSLSGIPFYGPIGASRVGYINNKYILNPNVFELSESRLDLVVSSTADEILTVESEAKFLNENQILDAIMYGHEQQQVVIENINKLVSKIGKPKWPWKSKKIDINLETYIIKLIESKLRDAYLIIEKKDRYDKIESIKSNVFQLLSNQSESYDLYAIKTIILNLEKNIVRSRILNEKSRIDNRKKDEIRKLDVRTSILPRTHGSAIFTRGDTQALVIATLGTDSDAQNIDDLIGERTDRFILHYNFPPYCIGEIGIMGMPKRREIGHGRLVKRSILAVMPNINEFPYTIRVVSEITESNGSSSMASVCGASLALMDAGVPIKSAVAGIAIGLIKDGDNFVVLSDIIGDEDRWGDMDLKVAGSTDGITALQMDIKTKGITRKIMEAALNQAKDARLYILNIMRQSINAPRNDISKFAPRIHTIKINLDKIKDVIGKGGSVIRSLTEETGTIIEIENDGTIKIVSTDIDKAYHAIRRIKEITADIEVGKIYNGKVIRIVNFGAFVSINNGKEGLVHISHISNQRVETVLSYLQIGQKVLVKVLEIDRQGRLRLSIKEANTTIQDKIALQNT